MPSDEPPFDLSDFLPYLLNQAAEAAGQDFQTIYKDRYGLLRTEWRVLFHLGNYGRMTAKEIGERASIHKTKVSRAVQKLAARRYLTRQRGETDRRFEYLELTSTGRAVYADLRKVAEAYDTRLAAQFSPDEVALLRAMLRRLAGRQRAK